MLEKQYKFRSIFSYKKVPKKFGYFISSVKTLKTAGYNTALKSGSFFIFNFDKYSGYQLLNKYRLFSCLLWQTRKVLY